MFKKLLIAVALLVVLLVGAGLYFFAGADRYVKSAIEYVGSQATQTDVTVQRVHLSFADGRGSLEGFRVANPKGFSSPEAIEIGAITLDVDTKSLMGDGPVIIQSIIVKHPEVTYEVAGAGDVNINKLVDNVKAYADSFKSHKPKDPGQDVFAPVRAKAEAEANAQKPEAPGRKIIIRSLKITEGEVFITHEVLGKKIKASLPTIEMSNIGSDTNGASSTQIANVVMGLIGTNATKVATKALAGELLNMKGGSLAKEIEQSLKAKLGF